MKNEWTSSSPVARGKFFYFDVANAAVLIYLAVARIYALDTHAPNLCLARLGWRIRVWLLRKHHPLVSLKFWHGIIGPSIKSILCPGLVIGLLLVLQVLWRWLQSSVTLSWGHKCLKIRTVFRVVVSSFQYTTHWGYAADEQSAADAHAAPYCDCSADCVGSGNCQACNQL